MVDEINERPNQLHRERRKGEKWQPTDWSRLNDEHNSQLGQVRQIQCHSREARRILVWWASRLQREEDEVRIEGINFESCNASDLSTMSGNE